MVVRHHGKRLPIGRGFDEGLRAHDAASAGLVFNHHGLAERFGELRTAGACDAIHTRACAHGEDEFHIAALCKSQWRKRTRTGCAEKNAAIKSDSRFYSVSKQILMSYIKEKWQMAV